jgi:putative tryptophan/tyrosine transport system substrate-binding protein
MNRRDLIVLLGGAATLRSFAVRAQKGDQMPRIGVLMGLAESDKEAQSDIAALRAGLKELGWSDGRNLAIDFVGVPGTALGCEHWRPSWSACIRIC